MACAETCSAPEVYSGIDIMKLVCAFLIVWMHTYCQDLGITWINNILSSVGVPFFFLASGFFYAKGLREKIEPRVYYLKYVKRASLMYLAWTVLTLPVSWYNLGIAHANYVWWMKVVYIFRCLFLTGSLGIYWYLLSLIYCSTILYIVYTYKKQYLLSVVAFVLFIIGLLYNSGLLDNTFIHQIIYVAIGSERNFLNVGLFYMCIGCLVYEKRFRRFNKYFVLAALCLVLMLEYKTWTYQRIHFMHALAAILLFIFSLNWNPRYITNKTYSLRKLSTVIYLSHFPFILSFDYYLHKGTNVDFPLTILFSFSFYFVLTFLFPDNIKRILIG